MGLVFRWEVVGCRGCRHSCAAEGGLGSAWDLFNSLLTVKASMAFALARVTATTYTFCSLVYMNEHMPRLTTGLPPRSLPLMISVLNALAMLRLGKGGREEEGARSASFSRGDWWED